MSCYRDFLKDLSIVIPISATETEHHALIENLSRICPNAEIIVCSNTNRAASLNEGISRSSQSYIWFLHADTLVSEKNINALAHSLHSFPNRLHYFNLSFGKNASLFLKITALGANIRSHLFGCPFGDQGFCIHRDLIKLSGLYNEQVSYGEDHIFIWQCKQRSIALHTVPSSLITSPRKYLHNGWLKVTLIHQYLWLKQAIPQWLRTLHHHAR